MASLGGYCPPGPPRLAPPARAASPGGYRSPDPPKKRLRRAGGAFWEGPGGGSPLVRPLAPEAPAGG
eukprot:15289623-Alexandrium_andersonii.AAC.1